MARLTANDYLPRGESREEVLERWAENVIQRWIKEIHYQDIKNPNRLIASLKKKVYNASGGDQTKIIFTLANYGRYVDLGVGRGEKYTKKKHDPVFHSGRPYPGTPGYSFQVKPWLMPLFKQRVYSLAQILERKYSEYAELMVIQNIAPEKFLNNNTNPL